MNPEHVAEVLEKFLSPIGIILFVPLAVPEQDKCIREIVLVKSFKYVKVMGIRLILAFTVLCSEFIIFTVILVGSGCKFPIISFTIGSLITAMALGSIGILTSILTGNAIGGYLVSIGYFLLNWIGVIEERSPLYLFSIIENEFEQKLIFVLLIFTNIMLMILYLKKRLLILTNCRDSIVKSLSLLRN